MKELLELLTGPTGVVTVAGLALYITYIAIKQKGTHKIPAMHFEDGQLVLTSSVIKYIDERARHKASQLVQIEKVHRESLQREVADNIREIRKDIENMSAEFTKHMDDDARIQDDINVKLGKLLSFHRKEDR